ncbi:MAG: hypothetical protein KTR20_03330 [Cellvibrionaceae bacterium]|nr:hypothetical protein [Cellvibrionaceae bacterium]
MNFNRRCPLQGWKQAFAKRRFALVVTPAMYHCWLALLTGNGKIDNGKSLILSEKQKSPFLLFVF